LKRQFIKALAFIKNEIPEMNIFQRKSDSRFSTFEILIWWEKRRILYNAIMFIVGILSFFIGYITIPIIYIFFAINLNILYTFSWIIEIVLKYFNSNKSTQQYVKWFSILFYLYSIIAVLSYIIFPQLLDWTLIPYGL